MKRFNALFELFAAADKELFLVGGCVRDLLMERAPKDFDFATNARPAETRRILRSAGLRAIPIGEAFGTIATQIEDAEVEITSYRVKESYKKGSRHPEVVFGERLEEDLSRRDLTINAMAMGIDGAVVDPFNGQQDLREGVLRVPGGGLEKTREIFSDDPLRMLRVGRFIARYGFTPDEATTLAARLAAETILEVSRERWRSEFERLLPGPEIEAGLRWLEQVGVLGECLPEVTALRGVCERGGEGDALDATLKWVAQLPGSSGLRWVGLLGRVGLTEVGAAADAGELAAASASMGEEIARRFRFSNHEREALLYLLGAQHRPTDADVVDRVSARRLMLDAGRHLEDVLTLAATRAMTDREAGARLEGLRAQIAEVTASGVIEPQLPRGIGHHLVETLGVERGPSLGALIAWLKEGIIKEQLPNEADANVYLEAARVKLGW